MGPREIARSNDGHANSISAEKNFATAKPKPWESQPYNYEVQKNAGSSSLSNPRQDYVERVHGPHQDSDSIPSDDDDAYGYAPSAFSTTSDLHASDPYAGDQGTLAGDLRYIAYGGPSHIPYPYKIIGVRDSEEAQSINKRVGMQQTRTIIENARRDLWEVIRGLEDITTRLQGRR
jgi:hypothetical protein